MNLKDRPALLLIDIQKGIDDFAQSRGTRNNPQAEENMGKILVYWREHALPIFHIKHNSTNPDSRLVKGKPGNEIKEVVRPLDTEPVIEKEVNSAFIGTGLQERLEKQGIEKLVIIGLTTEHCVSTTTRMAGNLGFDTYLISDACAAFDKVGRNGKKYSAELVHETEMASLHEEFATVFTSLELFKHLHALRIF